MAQAGIDYAVIGGNAVAAWASRVDDSVVRATQDVNLLVRREDMPAITEALENAGFRHRTVSILGDKGTIEMFLDGPGAKARDAVHLLDMLEIGQLDATWLDRVPASLRDRCRRCSMIRRAEPATNS